MEKNHIFPASIAQNGPQGMLKRIADLPTRAAQIEIEKMHGCRYSVLLELPYFYPIRMCIVDPMHNLLLGTAKYMMTVWVERKLIDHKALSTIQNKVNTFITPNDIGRIPNKISSGFSGFPAEQWRNWILIYSLSSLKEVLPREHYQCWHSFVKACYLLRRRVICQEQLQDADLFLQAFKFIHSFIQFQLVYGKECCTINIHLHGHLVSCMEDYGPVYLFWLFAFERLNGVMEAFHTNSHNIAPQLMRRFLDIHTNGILQWPAQYQEQFVPLLENHRFSKGSLSHTSLEPAAHNTAADIKLLPPVFEVAFEPHQLDSLKECLTDIVGDFFILPLIRKYAAISVNGHVIG